MSTTTDNRVHKYPNAFRYGFVVGVFLQTSVRVATKEPLSARPFSYLTLGLGWGAFSSFYDYWKRISMEEMLYAQSESNYHNMVAAMNNVRVGEEEETQNLVEYLTGTTTRL